MGLKDYFSKKNYLVIIGEKHDEESAHKLKKELIKRADGGEIILGLEGLVRNEECERRARSKLGVYRNVYGIEDDLASQFHLVALAMQGINHPGDEYDIMLKLEYALGTEFSPILEDLWSTHPDLLPLEIRQVHWRLSKAKEQFNPISTGPQKEVIELLQYGNRPWKAYLNYVYEHLMDQAEIPPDIVRAAKTVMTRKNNILATIKLLEWRNDFMCENMRQVCQKARQEDKDVYFSVGSMHVKGLSKRMGWKAEGFKKRAYWSWVYLPDSLRYGCVITQT